MRIVSPIVFVPLVVATPSSPPTLPPPPPDYSHQISLFHFPLCACTNYFNGLTTDNVGHDACARHDNGKLWCMSPKAPYIPKVDEGCPRDMYRCTVADLFHDTDFKFLTPKPYVKHLTREQPSFPPCTCSQKVNQASTSCSSAATVVHDPTDDLCQKEGESVCSARNLPYDTKIGDTDEFTCRSDQSRCTPCATNGAPIMQFGSYVACMVSCGVLKCWGDLDSGTIGTAPGDMATVPAVDLGAPGAKAVDLAIANANARYTMCVLLDIVYGHSNLKCWQPHAGPPPTRAALGQERSVSDPTILKDLSTIYLGAGRKAVRVKAAYDHACAILDNGGMKCWGYNGYAALGAGLSTSSPTTYIGDEPGDMESLNEINLGTGRYAIDLAVMEEYASCALLDNGKVKCWGYAEYIGIGCRTSSGNTCDTYYGDDPSEMGDNLPAVFLGTGRTAVRIDASTFTVCAVLDNGGAKCWGDASTGQAGVEMFGPSSFLLTRPCYSWTSYSCTSFNGPGAYIGYNAGDMEALPEIALGGKVKDIIGAGNHMTCALLESGEVKCFGGNSAGEAGVGSTDMVGPDLNDPAKTSYLISSLPAIDLGDSDPVEWIAAGYNMVCAKFKSSGSHDLFGKYKCWGKNDYGRLGIDSSDAYGDAPNEMGTNLPYMITTGLGGDAQCYAKYSHAI